MGISEGTLAKRGKYWAWKYRVDGRQYMKGLKTISKREAELVRQEWIAEYHQDRAKFLREDINPTIEEFEAQYFPWAESHKRPATIETERNFWGQFMAFTRAKRLGDISHQDVERFKAKLKRRGAKGKPLKEQSINDGLRHLQAIYNHAIRLRLFTGENPVVGVARYRITREMPGFLDENEVSRLLEAAQEHSQAIHWVILLALYAGLPKNEIVNARWEWLDFKNRQGPVIRVKRHEGFELKDHEERALPMSSKIADALRPHKKDQGFLFESGRAAERKWRYRYEPQRAFNAVKEAAGVPKANFLITRHTFASWHVMKGTEIALVSKWLGHSKVDITMKHYAGLKPYHSAIENF